MGQCEGMFGRGDWNGNKKTETGQIKTRNKVKQTRTQQNRLIYVGQQDNNRTSRTEQNNRRKRVPDKNQNGKTQQTNKQNKG